MKYQYEQQCNAAALQQMGVLCLKTINENFPNHFYNWINSKDHPKADYSNSINESLTYLFSGITKKEEQPVFIETSPLSPLEN